MKKTIAWILLGTMMISTLQGINPKKSSAEGNITVERIAGKNRYETSALVSKKVYDTADSVLVASGEAFPDALAAGVFANENNMPILLAPKSGDLSVSDGEIGRLGAKKAFIVGGEAAIGNFEEPKNFRKRKNFRSQSL